MKKLFIATALIAAMLVPTSQALASSHNPTGELVDFGECPLNNPAVALCTFSESTGGFFQIGAKTVPLKNPVVLQGGIEIDFEAEEGIFVAAENGETLSKTPQTVPGGLLGVEAPGWWPLWMQNLFNEYINNGLTGVTATVELAGPASAVKIDPENVLFEQGTGLGLPTKIKLSNALLGSNCYIGSNSNPVQIDFTSGETSPPPPNEPIHGSAGELKLGEETGLITLSGGSLVNNSFAAPKAHGCGGLLSLFIDPLVDSLIGLPSPAGTNSAVLEGKLELVPAESVRASEE